MCVCVVCFFVGQTELWPLLMKIICNPICIWFGHRIEELAAFQCIRNKRGRKISGTSSNTLYAVFNPSLTTIEDFESFFVYSGVDFFL